MGVATLVGTARLVQRGLQLRDSYLADAGWGQQMALLHYLSLRHENPDMEPYQVYQGLLYSLSLTNPKTAFSLALLVLSAALLLVAAFRVRWSRLAGLGLATLLAVDLVVFGLDYHPKASLQDISRLPPVGSFLASLPPGERVWVEPALSALEPNRLATARVWELWGYSSLESQRHWEYANSVDRQANVLLDLWGGRYFVGQTRHWDVALVDGTAYRPFELLLSGGAGNPTGRETYRVEPFLTSEVRILSALANAVTVPQGETVAEITLTGENGEQTTIPLRAGVETSEHAIDRLDVRPLAAHERAFVGATRQDSTPSGLAFTSNIYEARSTIATPFRVRDISVRVVVREGYLWLLGLGLVSPDGRVRSLFEEDKTKYEQVYRDDYATVYRNLAAYPRAFVVPEALVRPTRQSETAIARMALRPFEPRRQAVLEEGPFDDVPVAATQEPDQGPGALPSPTAVPVVDRSPTRLEMHATGPGVLVLSDAYHRGWRAYVDGREAPVYIANFLGRGVGLPPGEHDVVMVFDPLSWRLGLALSIATGIFCLAVFIWGARLRRRPPNE
ncbi:MAG: YfhO family protein [Chloroflexi bacterium]|nr:YfhO family protein [Chloroflexota bacterium]